MKYLKSKISTKDWIIKAKKIHGNRFIYDKTIYLRSTDKVKIICKLHGIFQQRASKHLEGSACKKCNIESQRKTTSKFIIDSKSFHGDYYDYSKVKFNSIHDKVKIICPVHGFFYQTPAHHQKGRGCKKCTKGEVWSTKDFIKKSIKVHKDKFDYSKTKYSKTNIKVKIKCKKCKISFDQTPASHLRGVGCANCAGQIPITEDTFKIMLSKTHDGKIILLSKYYNKSAKVRVQCKCGNVWSNTSNHIIKRKQGCKKCYTLSQTFTNTKFKKLLKEEHGGSIIPLENYEMSKKSIRVRCKKCKKEYKSQPRSLLRHGCKNCAYINQRRSNNEFITLLKKIHFKEIIPLERYVSGRTKIKVKHKCGYTWKVSAGELIRKDPAGCPLCATSWGNKKIYYYLKKKKILFLREKRFSSCKYKIPLPFDFYIPSKKILIEYDGEQHFSSVDIWGGKKGLKERVLKDKIKTNWAKKNNYFLYRIAYNENITKSLDKITKNAT